MAATHYGDEGTGAITWYKNQPTRERENDQWNYVWKGWCAKDSADDLIPDDLAEMPGDADYLLRKVAVEDTDAPGIVDITLTYTYKGGASWDWFDPDEIDQRCEVATLEIGRARAYNAGGELQERADEAMEAQEETVKVGGLRYEYGYYESDFEWSEANLVLSSGLDGGAVKAPGELGKPSGLTGAVTAGKWMYRGKRIERRSKSVVKIGEQWEYSPAGWGEAPAP
jgi:hypothetical protein